MASDVDEFIEPISGWKADYARISPGPFEGCIAQANIGGLHFVYAKCNQSIQVTGHTSAGCYSFTPVHSQNSESRFRTRFLMPGEVNILEPGEPMFHLSARGFELAQVEIPAETVQQVGRDRLGVDAAALIAGRASISVDAQTCNVFFRTVRTHLHSAVNIDSLDVNSMRLLHDLAVDLVIRLLHASNDQTETRNLLVSRKSLFYRALNYMNSALGDSVRLASICSQLDISERSLISLFRDFVGISPKQYLNIVRLNRIRWDLKSAKTSETVSDIAMRWGVEYSGVFAAKYKQHFGDLPSETLGALSRSNC